MTAAGNETDEAQRAARGEPAPSASVAESAAALDTVLVEMEDVLRDLSARTLDAATRATPQQVRQRYTDLDRTLRRLRTDLRSVSDMAVPSPVRRAAADAAALGEPLHRLAGVTGGRPIPARSQGRDVSKETRRSRGFASSCPLTGRTLPCRRMAQGP